MNVAEAQGHGRPGQGEPVSITVDDNALPIEAGHYKVAEIKKLAGVAEAYILDELIEGRWVPRNDNATVVIRGGETFDSHPPKGGSS